MTKAVIFDVGNVLIEWDVRHLYRQLLPDDAAIDAFLDETGLLAANVEFDRGLPFAEGIADLCQKFPQHAELLRAFDTRWMDSVPGEIAGSVAILRRLGELGVPRYAITNFSREKWALSTERFPFLRSEFIDIVVSAHEGIVKPDRAIYRLLLDRNGLDAGNCIFIDDSAANIVAARETGIDAIHFTPSTQLRQELAARGIAP